MFTNQEYTKVSLYENPRWGLKICVAGFGTDEYDVPEHIAKLCSHAMDELADKISAELIALAPETKNLADETVALLLNCFPPSERIYAKRIVNEYFSPATGEGLSSPWLLVTTRLGNIKLGWRKRVISIDWSDSEIAADALTLFPDEDVTKGGKMIHAWGYEKASEYISSLLKEHK